MPLVASVGLSAQPVHEPDSDVLAAKRMLSSGPPDEGHAEGQSLISGPSSAAKTRSGSRWSRQWTILRFLITAGLARVGFALPGTLTERMTRCGYPGCRCHADPPQLHGPYHQWTAKSAGKPSPA